MHVCTYHESLFVYALVVDLQYMSIIMMYLFICLLQGCVYVIRVCVTLIMDTVNLMMMSVVMYCVLKVVCVSTYTVATQNLHA